MKKSKKAFIILGAVLILTLSGCSSGMFCEVPTDKYEENKCYEVEQFEPLNERCGKYYKNENYYTYCGEYTFETIID